MIAKTNWADLTFPVSVEPITKSDLARPGKAWLCDLEIGHAVKNVRADQDACICHWVVEAAWAHPAWHSYSIFCQHLRPMEGYDVPVITHLEGATHEMLVFALDPTKDRESMIKTGIVDGRWMSPPNFAAQFIVLNDNAAMVKIRQAIDEIVSGRLSPDTDFRSMWVDRFGGNMVKS